MNKISKTEFDEKEEKSEEDEIKRKEEDKKNKESKEQKRTEIETKTLKKGPSQELVSEVKSHFNEGRMSSKSHNIEFKDSATNKQVPKIQYKLEKDKIPIIKISNPSIEFKKFEENKEISNIQKRSEKTEVFVLKFEKYNPELVNSIEIKKEILNIDETKEKILIPILKTDNVKVEGSELDIKTNLPKVSAIINDNSSSKQQIDSSKEDKTLEDLIEDHTGERMVEKEIKKPINYLGLKPSKIKGKPIVIFLRDKNDSFIGSLEEICLKIYREIKGGSPKPRKLSDLDKFMTEIEKWLEAQDKIFTVDFHEDDYKKVKTWDVIRDELSQLYGQGIGFIIFKNLGLISDSYIPRDHKIKILYIKPNSNLEEDIEAQKALCSLIWGMIGFTDRDFKIYSQLNFDVIFSIAKEKYENFFDKIREPYLTLTKKNKGGIESDDSHFIIKLFIVKFISNELGYKNIDDLPKILNLIKIEESNNLKVLDIYVTSEAEVYPNEAFEVETLFGQGTHAVKKLDETIEKYKELQPKVTKLNIVLDNLTFLMHMDEIRDKRKIHEKLREVNIRNFDLEFWTLNLKDNKLINFNDFSKELKILKNKNYLPIFQNQ